MRGGPSNVIGWTRNALFGQNPGNRELPSNVLGVQRRHGCAEYHPAYSQFHPLHGIHDL
jgi:hypothetical protein